MAYANWTDPRRVLAATRELVDAPLTQILTTLSRITADLVPHSALVMLTGDCPKSPTWSHGDDSSAEDVTIIELTRLSTLVDVGTPWYGEAVLGGSSRPVLAIASAPDRSAGALLVLLLPEDRTAPEERVLALVQELWDLATVRVLELLPRAVPVNTPWMADSERARLAADLTDAHASSLTTLLGVLRSRSLDDAAARRAATDLAASVVVELRAADDAPVPREETVEGAFERLSDMLGLLSRYGNVAVEFAPPRARDGHRVIRSAVAHAARTTARGTVLTMLEQGGVSRIRVGWHVEESELRTTVRDDGPGDLAAEALAMHQLTDRVAALHGSLDVDAVPGWGTTVTARLPLVAPDVPLSETLGTLHPRELDVLRQLVHGHRNRVIAQNLHISEHTVKSHVASILRKLDVSSRGEAAAVARASGFPALVALSS
ncbi:LuxR C-terminal-related transcriptional regulator [Nocardiopsis aegyptia]|uniref:helix-turn-helix transcriptional regulator n=1 Tax=Nocardiopsis aegyptia TaxID=220378 RepID=UPI00366E1B0B